MHRFDEFSSDLTAIPNEIITTIIPTTQTQINHTNGLFFTWATNWILSIQCLIIIIITDCFLYTAIISTSYNSTEYASDNLQTNELERIDINTTYRNDLSYKDHYSDMSSSIILSQVSTTIKDNKMHCSCGRDLNMFIFKIPGHRSKRRI